jgi:S1-C subfamily serine protease
VIGVNSQIASDAARTEGSQPGSTGVGFAIASNLVARAVKKIEAEEGVSSSSANQSAVQRQTETEGGSGSAGSPEAGEVEASGVEEGSREISPSGVEEGSGLSGVEGVGEAGSTGSTGPEATGEGREGQIMIVP